MCGAYPDPLFCKDYGIVGRWLFNEKGSRLVDVCRNFSTGAISGATWTGSRMGGGLRFDGSDDYVNIGRRIQRYVDYNKPFTITIWYTLHTFSGAGTYSFIGTVNQIGGLYDQFELNITSDKFRVIMINVLSGNVDGRIWDSVSTIGHVINKQYCVTWVYDGLNADSTEFYFNGVFANANLSSDYGNITRTIWQSGSLADKDLWVGRRNFSTGDQPFPGIIDQIIIANRVWTPDEVKTFYRKPWSGLISSSSYDTAKTHMEVIGA